MDYKQEFEKFNNTLIELKLIKSNLSKRILEITGILCEKYNRLQKFKSRDYGEDIYIPYPVIPKDTSCLKWSVSKTVIEVSWDSYRGGGEYNTYWIEFDYEFLYDDAKFSYELGRLDKEVSDLLDDRRKQKETEEEIQAQAEWDLYQKLSKKYSANTEKLDVSQ